MTESFLSQEEVDALLEGVTGESQKEVEQAAQKGEVRPYDISSQERIVRGRMPTMEIVNERFARNLRLGLFNLIRRTPEVSIGSIAVQRFGAFLRELSVPTNFNIMAVRPLRGNCLIVCEPALIFGVIDTLYGGTGKFQTRIEGRDFSATEHRVIARLIKVVAEEYKKILLVEPAVADSITGEKWNKYIFRTGRNSSQDAIANAAALDQAGISIATLAQDYAFGRDGVKAFKDALHHAKIVHEEYLPQNTTDFTAGIQRVVDALKDKPGKKAIEVIWAGGTPPFNALAAQDLKKRYGIDVFSGGNILPAMAAYKNFPGMEGATYYYFGIPKNPVNDAMVSMHYKEFKAPPDFFTAGGFSAAMAIVTALKATGGDTNTNKLIKTMEGMSFDTPKGKMTFRKEDHQAMQSMYHFRIKNDPAFAWGVPELVHEIKPEEMQVPIRNKR